MERVTFDTLYDYVDQSMIEGCSKAKKIIKKYGYKATYDMLYDYVDQRMIEGCWKAELLITGKTDQEKRDTESTKKWTIRFRMK